MTQTAPTSQTWLSPDVIRTDGGTQHRPQLDEAAIRDYAAAMRQSEWDWSRSPLLVYYDGEDYWLVGGFHRKAGAKLAKLAQVACEVRQGTRREAVLASFAENNENNAVRLSNAAKRNKVTALLADPEWRAWSDSKIARRCNVHHTTVANIRAELYPAKSQDSRQVERGGTTYVMQTANIGASQGSARGLEAMEALYHLHRIGQAWIAPGGLERTLRGALPTLEAEKLLVRRQQVNAKHEIESQYQISAQGFAFIGKPAIDFEQESKPQYDMTDPQQNPLLETHPGWAGNQNPAICPKCGDAHFQWKPLPGAYWRCQKCGEEVRDDVMQVETAEDRAAQARMALRRNGEHVPEPDKPTPSVLSEGNGKKDPDEWYTPPEILAVVRALLGEIDVDPASCDHAQESVQALTYYTKETNGLEQKWHGRVWLNPPYSYPLVEQFTGRLLEQYEAGITEEAIVLVNNRTDADWFQQLLKRSRDVCFVAGRINFERYGLETSQNRQGQAFFYLGERYDLFEAVFEQFGTVLPCDTLERQEEAAS